MRRAASEASSRFSSFGSAGVARSRRAGGRPRSSAARKPQRSRSCEARSSAWAAPTRSPALPRARASQYCHSPRSRSPGGSASIQSASSRQAASRRAARRRVRCSSRFSGNGRRRSRYSRARRSPSEASPAPIAVLARSLACAGTGHRSCRTDQSAAARLGSRWRVVRCPPPARRCAGSGRPAAPRRAGPWGCGRARVVGPASAGRGRADSGAGSRRRPDCGGPGPGRRAARPARASAPRRHASGRRPGRTRPAARRR
jgi:hypothetical protein